MSQFKPEACLRAVALSLAMAVISAVEAQAQGVSKNCYEDIGCPWQVEAKATALRKLSCENLAHVRNRLYHENGYCFRTKPTRDLYGNQGCRHTIQALVPLTRTERASIANVRKVEREKGC